MVQGEELYIVCVYVCEHTKSLWFVTSSAGDCAFQCQRGTCWQDVYSSWKYNGTGDFHGRVHPVWSGRIILGQTRVWTPCPPAAFMRQQWGDDGHGKGRDGALLLSKTQEWLRLNSRAINVRRTLTRMGVSDHELEQVQHAGGATGCTWSRLLSCGDFPDGCGCFYALGIRAVSHAIAVFTPHDCAYRCTWMYTCVGQAKRVSGGIWYFDSSQEVLFRSPRAHHRKMTLARALQTDTQST